MPHVIVKIVGKSEEEKVRLSQEITKALMTAVQSKEENISINIEDVEKDDWTEKVYKPDILTHWDTLYKKPGYDPLK